MPIHLGHICQVLAGLSAQATQAAHSLKEGAIGRAMATFAIYAGGTGTDDDDTMQWQ